MERVHELMSELLEAIRQVYPAMTDADIHLGNNGYQSIEVKKWDSEYMKPAENRKRKVLLDQFKGSANSPWSTDQSSERNQFLLENNVLLED